jgi:hypothetical protein
VLRDQQWIEIAVTIVRNINGQRPIIGQKRLGAPAVTVVGDILWLGLPSGIAQVMAHFRAQGAFNSSIICLTHKI